VGAQGITLRDPANPTQNKVFYSDGNPQIQIKNPDNSNTDLILYRLSTDPQLPTLTISTATPAVGNTTTFISTGVDRGAYFNSGGYKGYYWGDLSTRKKLWGTNKVYDTHVISPSRLIANDGFGVVYFFTTRFDDPAGSDDTPDECQAADKDSGSAVFRLNGSQWELAGVPLSVTRWESQPPSSAVFGNESLMADLRIYHDKITPYSQMIPGDANLDGKVDIVDLSTVGTNWQQFGVGWSGGDFNSDNIVDVVDLGLVGTHWQESVLLSASPGGMSFEEAVSMVQLPEPSGLLVLGAAIVLMGRSGRRCV
jgi:hypothetical protein